MHIYQLITVQYMTTLIPNMFLLFFSLILNLVYTKPTIVLDSYIGLFLLFTPGSSQSQNCNSVITFPHLINLVFPFLVHNECQPMPEACNLMKKLSLTLLTLHMLLFCFLSLALHTKHLSMQLYKSCFQCHRPRRVSRTTVYILCIILYIVLRLRK